MKHSKYNYILNCNDEFNTNDFLLYNTKSGAAIVLEDVETDIKSFLIEEGAIDKNFDSKMTEFLYENGFMIDDEQDELKDLQELYYNFVNDNNVLNLTVLPTEDCNFACPYCFLYNKSALTMSEEDYEVVLQLIENFCKSDNAILHKKRIIINWFGGEPTLHLNQIVEFMKKVNKLKFIYGFNLFSSITTNGYLLNSNNFCELLRNGISEFQVTIDGSKESHDKTRYLKNKKGTFDVIFSNLISIAQLTPEEKYNFSIRGNFNKKTFNNMKDFIKLYCDNLHCNPNFNLYFRPIYEYETKKNEIQSMSHDLYNLDDGIYKQNELMEEIKKTTNQKMERRLMEELPSPTFGWCNAEMNNHYIIGKDCRLYLCDTLIGQKSIGYLNKNGTAEYLKEAFRYKYNIFEDEKTKKCLHCKRLPICYGGCRRNRLINEAQCYWDDKTIETLMKQSYSNWLKSKKGGD